MKLIINSVLVLLFLALASTASALKAPLIEYCEYAGYHYVEHFDVTDVYPSLMGPGIGPSPISGNLSSPALFFGNNNTGSVYAVLGFDSKLSVDNLLNVRSRSISNMYGLVYAALAVNQLIDICAKTDTNPNSVVAIRYSLDNLHKQDSDTE